MCSYSKLDMYTTELDSSSNFDINLLPTTSTIIIASHSRTLIPVKHQCLKLHVCNSKVGPTSSFLYQDCTQKDQVPDTHVHVHNTARSVMDMKRDGYKDQNVSTNV